MWLLATVPVGALIAPLFFHRSGAPEIGSYSASYFWLLMAVSVAGLGMSTAVALVSHRKVTRKPVFAFVAVTVGSAIAVGTAELGLRMFANDEFAKYREWGHRKAALFGYEAAPDHSWMSPPTDWSDPGAAGVTYTTNRFGMRTHCSDRNWPAAPGKHIFAIGGSSVFGFGLADDQTWPHMLEAKLRGAERVPAVQVINAGNNGHNSLQCLLRFYLRVLPHKPNVVLFYESNNDVADSVNEPTNIWIDEDVLFSDSLSSYLSKKHREKNWYARTLLGHRLQRWLKRSARKRARSGGRRIELSDAQAEAELANGERYIRNVTTIADICRRNGVTLVLMTFIQDGANRLLNNERSVNHFNDRLRLLAQQEGIPLIDLARDFEPMADKPSFFFTDHYHPSPKGAEWIAAQVTARLPELLAK